MAKQKPPLDEEDRLLTPGELAALFRVSRTTVTRWAAKGRITAVRTPGGHRRYRESDVRGLLRGAQADANPGGRVTHRLPETRAAMVKPGADG
jgi:excisionase family DNA binding protein